MEATNLNKKSLQPLENYLPQRSLELIQHKMQHLHLKIKITNTRKTKYGDYRAPINLPYHQITVNGDLNPYHFLITFLHELAHLNTYVHYQNKVKPHGKEWKRNFKVLLIEFIQKKVFPTDIAVALSYHLERIKASTSSDLRLTNVLRKYDQVQTIVVADIPINTFFKLADGRVFKKGAKRRTRYKCLCMDTKREYLFSPFYQIIPLEL